MIARRADKGLRGFFGALPRLPVPVPDMRWMACNASSMF
jgi:hypothetical protein